MADFNGDGAADIAVVNSDFQSGASTVAVMLNKGDGTFPKSQTYALKFRARAIGAGDFNNDGNLDFASGSQTQLGNGDGTFVAGGNLPKWYQNIAVGDFKRDGVTDLLGGDYNGGPTAVLLGAGDGTFRPVGDALFAALYGLAVGDFNRDGWLDAVAVTWSEGPLGPWVSLNDGNW